MSEKSLRKAARLRIPQQMPDIESKLMMMLMADRSDDTGRFTGPDEDQLIDELASELDAVRARLRGDQFVRPGVDNGRVTRVVNALRDAEAE